MGEYLTSITCYPQAVILHGTWEHLGTMFSQSLARPARHAARCVAGRLAGFIQPPMLQRHIATIHNAKAQFVTIDSFGGLVSKGVTIYRAGEDEAFVLIDQEVGLAMKAALVRQIGISLTKNPEAIPLKFYHKSLHFAHGTDLHGK